MTDDDRSSDNHRSETGSATPGRVLSNRTIAVCAVILVVLAAGLAWLLLTRFGDGTEVSKTRLDGIRTVGTIVLGAGGAIALLLTARRQQTAERDLVEKRRDLALKERAQSLAEKIQQHNETVAAATLAHQVRVADDTKDDASARRITELFDKAVDKLGAEKAAVRFGGLYALERLAGHAPDQQAAITQVLCAYLRMPYNDPGEDPGPAADEDVHNLYLQRREEREVRLAIQRVLGAHLIREPEPDHGGSTYWAAATIDLTSATLTDINWSHCHIPNDVQFTGATFIGTTSFQKATFSGDALFAGATFVGYALFEMVTFAGGAQFEGALFSDQAMFERVRFLGYASFNQARFNDHAWFNAATFWSATRFSDAATNVSLGGARKKIVIPRLGTEANQWPRDWILEDMPPPLLWAKLVQRRRDSESGLERITFDELKDQFGNQA